MGCFFSSSSVGTKNYPRNMVIVHGAGRGPFAPSLSPFVLKVETYLRMANIPYQLDPGYGMSKQFKIPWIEYNGEIINDSSFIIEYFNQKQGVDLDRGLSPIEKATARAFQKMCEENLYWGLNLCRWWYNYGSWRWIGMLRRHIRTVGVNAYRNAYGHGIGRHKQKEVLQIMEADVQALSEFLGDKQFMMGSEPTEVDSSIFGIVSQMVWHSVDQPAENLANEKYPNLRNYCMRMKELYWSDWDDCITHGGTKKPIK